MLNIIDAEAMARALDSPVADSLRHVLRKRSEQLMADSDGEYDLGDLAHFIVIEPRDSVAEIEIAAGYPVVTSPAFEWVADHGGWYEAVTILSDDGFGIVLLVPDGEGVDQSLLALLRELAEPSASDGLIGGQEGHTPTA
jgi:hypothetical protein